nr:ATP synthase F0 subunit 6 [Ceratocombus sp. HL-2012]
MMTNLFSAFDPSTSFNISLNWTSTFIMILIMPYMYWCIPSRYMMTIMLMMNFLIKEFKIILNKNKGFLIMIISLFMFILWNNVMGLMPYVFTSSSHLVFTLSMALPMWMSIMMFGWTKKSQQMFSHLIPIGTPSILMPFMVCIETISNLIRPGSLAVRLTANMIAGHLLMSLLGNNINTSKLMISIIIIIQMMLMLFEMAVSMIQAYVFSILSTLYSSEVMYENK